MCERGLRQIAPKFAAVTYRKMVGFTMKNLHVPGEGWMEQMQLITTQSELKTYILRKQ